MSTVIFLHGASSSGKSTLAAAIRKASVQPFVHLSLDHFRDSGAVNSSDYPDWTAARPTVFEGLHRSFSAFADAGCDMIIEHILDTEGWHAQLQKLLAAHDVLFVGVMTPVSVLRERETGRQNRPVGSAEHDATRVHQGLIYDLELDGTQPPDANAKRVLKALQIGTKTRSSFFNQV